MSRILRTVVALKRLVRWSIFARLQDVSTDFTTLADELDQCIKFTKTPSGEGITFTEPVPTRALVTSGMSNGLPDGRLYVNEQYLSISDVSKPYGEVSYLNDPPIISDSLIVNGYNGPWRYNHDSAIASLDGRLYAFWNATLDGYEGGSNQVILLSLSDDDGVTWSTPIKPFSDPLYCLTPVATTGCQQWQPSVIAHKNKLIVLWDKTGTTSGCYLSIFDPVIGKWTATEIGHLYLPIALSDNIAEVYTRLATQTAIYLLSSGRLLCPMILQAEVSAFSTDRKRMVSLYSDDDGQTWQLGTATGSIGEGAGAWEPYLTERTGVLMAYIRRLTGATDGRVTQYVVFSFDGGNTWSTPRLSGWDIASSRGASARLPDGRWAIVHHMLSDVATNPRNRRALSVWLSDGGHNAAPAYCISGTRRGATWSYPAVCIHKGKLAIISSRSNLGDGSVRQIGVTICDIPNGYVFSASGQSKLKLTPTLINGVLAFGGGETRFAYLGNVSEFGGTAATVCIAGSIVNRWGRAATSSPDGTWYLFDNKVGVAGFALRVGNGTTGVNSNRVYLEYYSLGVLTDQITLLRVPDSGKYTLYVTLSGVSVTATMVDQSGLVTTDSLTLAETPTSFAGLSPSFYSVISGTWTGAHGDIAAASYYDTALSTSQLRQWHLIYGVRYNIPEWSGAVAELPVSNGVLLDPQGSLSLWPTLDAAPGAYYYTDDELTASGLFSLPIPTPLDESGEITFRYKAPAGRVNTTPICTVGTADRYLTLYKSALADTVYMLKSWQDDGSNPGRAIKSAQDVALADNTWYSVTLKFQGRNLIIEHDKVVPVKVEMPVRPQVFLGWGWRYSSKIALITTDAMIFDTKSVGYRNIDYGVEAEVPAAWIAWSPILLVNGSSVGVTYSSTTRGVYQIKDGIVYGTFDITLTSKGTGSGAVTITGMPYPAKNLTGNRHFGIDVSIYSNLNAAFSAPVQAYLQSSIINFVYPAAGGQAVLQASSLTDTTTLRGSFWFFAQD